MADIVIVAYRPKPGQAEALVKLAAGQVFEWADSGIAKAHQTPEVQEMWARYAAACDYIPLRELPEAAEMFAEFKPVNV
jgi:hypothetical protein